jgi:hypothetical protein
MDQIFRVFRMHRSLWVSVQTVMVFFWSITAEANRTHPLFDRCGEYTVSGIIHCAANHTQLIQNPGTDSEFRIRTRNSSTACEFYRDRPIRLNIRIRSLNLNSEAIILDQTLHRVLPDAMIIPPQLKKESPCE